MVFSFSTLLALAVVVATVTAQSCPCPKHYFPLCGSDGTTYGNDCTFRCAKAYDPTLILTHEGKCRHKRSTEKEDFCPCTRERRLQCGTDGVTYNNPCLLKCAAEKNPDLKKAYDGFCVEAKQQKVWPCACARNYRPVCGSDGVTYGNECNFHCEQNTKPDLFLRHRGECRGVLAKRSAGKEEQCPCTKELNLQCGTDGKTYGNPCLLQCVAKTTPGLETAHPGPCLESD